MKPLKNSFSVSNCCHGSRLFALCHFFCHKSKPLPFLCRGISVYFI
ncbi:hypothetical protein EUBVEN_02066 [Eubacterium ventriosum ATCC 27560]|uniref:Uncharacterized protein n=1 Tax=Eubacterium ventriosum ATCC 27560 TaxID=411463 RepID=A5Z8M5_9FIRM|nr:hypothetical protein EUBVEN_02066 [Eubacterium ventriosum ATCC 27560]